MHAWIADSLETDTIMKGLPLENPIGGTEIAPVQNCRNIPQSEGRIIIILTHTIFFSNTAIANNLLS